MNAVKTSDAYYVLFIFIIKTAFKFFFNSFIVVQ